MAHPSQSSALEPMVVLEQGHNGEISVVPTMNVLVGTICKNSFCMEKIPLFSLNGAASKRY